MKKTNGMFEKSCEWSGYRITRATTGFVVSGWSHIHGERSGYKYLYKFDNRFTPETDLSASWNESLTRGEYLAQTIRDKYDDAKDCGYKGNIVCLAKGDVVR